MSGEVRFDDRVVAITGAGRGMGRTHALLLASRGAKVVVNDYGGSMHGAATAADPASEVVDEIEAAGGEAVANREDVSSSAGCDALIAASIAAYGRVDAVIHNAGIFTFTPVPDISDGTWDRVIAVQLDAAFNLTRAAWPHFVRQGGGSVLYISSGAALYASPTLAHYGAAKAGVLGLARVIGAEGGPLGIRVNALAVGAHTRMTSFMLKESPNLNRFWEENYKPELVSAAAAWLVHPDCEASGRFYEAFGSRIARIDFVESRGYRKLDLTVDDVRDNFAEVEDFGDLGENVVFETQERFQDYLAGTQIELGATPPEPDEVLPTQAS